MEKATHEQKTLLNQLSDLIEEEERLSEEYVEKIVSGKAALKGFKGAGSLTFRYGLSYADLSVFGTIREREILQDIRIKIKDTIVKAAEYGMGRLEIVQRNYERFVGELMPEKYTRPSRE